MFDETPYYEHMAEYCLRSYRANLDTAEVMRRFTSRRSEAKHLLSEREYNLLKLHILYKSYCGDPWTKKCLSEYKGYADAQD